MDGPPINLKVYQNPQQVYIILLNKEFKKGAFIGTFYSNNKWLLKHLQ